MSNLYFLDPNPDGKIPVLLLHGMGASGESWSLQYPVLIEAGFRPLVVDIPGFGNSRYTDKSWSVHKVAEVIMDAVREITPGNTHVVGLSMGGVIAQQIAHDFPERTKKVVLVSTFSRLRPETLSGWLYFFQRIAALALRGMPAQAEVVAKRVFPLPEQEYLREMLENTIVHSDPRAYRKAMLALSLFNSSHWLGRIEQPVLVVTGSQDTTVSPGLQRKLAETIPGSRQVTIEGGGHAVPVDHAEEFNKIILEFLHE